MCSSDLVENDENSTFLTKNRTAPPSSCEGINSNSAESKSGAPSSHLTERLQKNLELQEEAENRNFLLPQEELKDLEDPFTADIQDLPSFDLLSFEEQKVSSRMFYFLPASSNNL